MASAGLVLAAFRAGYRLPSAPSNTAVPKPSSIISGVIGAAIILDPLPRKGLGPDVIRVRIIVPFVGFLEWPRLAQGLAVVSWIVLV
jgi:hypothetical protein